MSIFGRFFDGLQRRAFSLLDTSGYGPGVPAYVPRDFLGNAKESYLENVVGYACVHAIATTCAGIPLMASKRLKNGKKVRYATHPLLDFLNSPNIEQSYPEWAQARITYYLLAGSAWSILTGWPLDEKQKLTKGRLPTGMVLARPDLVRPVPDALGFPQSYRVGLQSAASAAGDGSAAGGIQYDRSRVIQWKAFHPTNPLFGLSPTEAAGKEIDTLNAMTAYYYRLIRRSGRTDGIVISKMGIGTDQYERMKKQVDEKLNNSNNAGGWKLFEGDIDVKEMTFKPTDMGFSKHELQVITKACMAFHVPPEIIGVPQAKTFANYQEARLAFYQDCCLPLMDLMIAKDQQRLVPLFAAAPGASDADVLEYDKDAIEALQEDRDALWTRTLLAEGQGTITNNEFRQLNQLPLSTDSTADIRLIGMARIPAEDLLKEPEPAEVDASAEGQNGTGDGGQPDETDPDLENPDDSETGAGSDSAPAKGGKAAAARARRAQQRAEPLIMSHSLDGASQWRAFDTTRTLYVRSARSTMERLLGNDYAAAAKAVRATQAGTAAGCEGAVRDALHATRGAWDNAYRALYGQVGADFAKRVDKGLEQMHGARREKRLGDAGLRQVRAAAPATWERYITDYLAKQGTKKISNVGDTTRARIMSSLSSSYEAGLGSQGAAAALEADAPRATAGRALLIARTEIGAASNLGSDAAARAFGIPLTKSWLATDDNRTRDDHTKAETDNQDVPLDSAFAVGSDQMMFPLDDSMGAGADEICNCRCATTYAAVDGAASSGDQEGDQGDEE